MKYNTSGPQGERDIRYLYSVSKLEIKGTVESRRKSAIVGVEVYYENC